MLLENVRDHAIFTLDDHGIITSWNSGAQQIFHYTEKEIVGQDGAILFTLEDRREMVPQKELATAAHDGRASDDRWQLRKEKVPFWASGVTASMRDRDGRLRGFIKVLRDLTQNKLLEEHRERLFEQEKTARQEAEKAMLMKDEFLAVVSHELRTPLTSILLWTRILRGEKSQDPELKQMVETIERSAVSQQQLIEDLLDVSRMLSGKLRVHIRETDLTIALESAIEAVRPMAQAKNITIQATLDHQAGKVLADPDRIQQVVWNLLNNAVKFTPVGGRVLVKLERAGPAVQMIISDTGRGISPEFMPFVFDRFRQADSSATRKHGGLGLGLAIVRQLVELHGGTIRALSEGENQGTTFIVELPLVDLHTPAPKFEPPVEPSEVTSGSTAQLQLKGLRMLVVEDEPETRLGIKRLLEQFKAEVEAVDSASAALQALHAGGQSRTFDAIISDIGMPGEDGYHLLRQVRAMEEKPEMHDQYRPWRSPPMLGRVIGKGLGGWISFAHFETGRSGPSCECIDKTRPDA